MSNDIISKNKSFKTKKPLILARKKNKLPGEIIHIRVWRRFTITSNKNHSKNL